MSRPEYMRRAGYTIIELLIAMSLTAMLAVPLTYFSIKGWSSYLFLQAQSNTTIELDILANRVSKVLRGTTQVVDAQANTLTIYAFFSPQDTVVKKIRYFISGNTLNIGVTPPSGTAPNYTYPAANEVVTSARTDLAMGATPMFTYFDDSGNQLPNAFNVSQVKQIGVFVGANASNKQVTVPISVTARVTLRNFKTNL